MQFYKTYGVIVMINPNIFEILDSQIEFEKEMLVMEAVLYLLMTMLWHLQV